MSEIQRYDCEICDEYASCCEPMQKSKEGDWVTYDDHAAALAAERQKLTQHAQIVRTQVALNEQERCRREEVEPLWTAIGEVFSAAHRLSHAVDSNAVDAVLAAADKSIRIRANVGEVQLRSTIQPDPLAADRQRIKRWIEDIMERREFNECWFADSEGDCGDCGNWPTCNPDCTLRNMMDYVGIVPQEDGGLDRQPEV